ncbi:L-threonylcarbamoyladenylate synthase [Desulfosporosinus sp.]|uniref:L-threonylcarbamoyladenylate synthase n=1 Tax=Desulfosporosinus sp. TaxID=157907 RepID=UPI0023183635|nr:L-threonylcarbamoyladenylate synthase [Desulfosporosinus sp.]MCO5386159.1 L-threonylcarbamoyladenylate synthase [Desulfosporosinus sp.]MDA8220467.1 L-threonylcarbamoyladenylate synthase [Desulfitobacterium hafniense]
MQTKRSTIDRLHPEAELINEGAEWLKAGELVAFPTETVYGLGANALDASACAKIFEAKGRPQDNPLIVHVCNLVMANNLVESWTSEAELCVQHFWPGPLTLILPKTALVPDIVTAGLVNVAIRMPSHPVALRLIEEAGFPIAAPSANLSGKPSPTRGSHVWRDMKGKIPLILDAGACEVGLESTVLDVSGGVPTILRPGGITKEQLEEVLSEVRADTPSENQAPKAPGMKYRHYAPRGELLLVSGLRDRVVQRMGQEILRGQARLKKVAVLCTLESASLLHNWFPDLLFVLGSKDRPQEVASNIFEGLRLCDERKMDLILVEGIEEAGLGSAVMNRLEKAAGKRTQHI